MTVKNRLKHWRHKLEMNQTEFAEFLGVPQNQYCRYENQIKQPGLENVIKIITKLNTKLEEVFYIDPEE